MMHHVSRVVLVGAAVLLSSTMAAVPAQAASWTSGGVEKYSQYTRCWERKKLSSDGSSTRDYYSFRMTISANSTNDKWLQRTWVEPRPYDGVTAAQPRSTVPIVISSVS